MLSSVSAALDRPGAGGAASFVLTPGGLNPQYQLTRGRTLHGHLVVRGTYLPGTTRCIVTDGFHSPPQWQSSFSGGITIKCYADVRANEYVIGSGPSALAAIAYWLAYLNYYEHEDYLTVPPDKENETEAQYIERIRLFHEQRLGGGDDNIEGREAMLFLGPSTDVSVEAWEVMRQWRLERRDDGTVVAVHPLRDAWRDASSTFPNDYNFDGQRSKLEIELSAFRTTFTAEHEKRVAANTGRVLPEAQYPNYPMLVTDANQLSGYYREVGAYDHEDGPPLQPPSVGCASAAAGSGGLASDCTALLAAKDALRGTATLNWSVERPIAEWDGVTTGGTPLRVTRLELPEKSLTGSVPSELGRLSGLTRLDLSANSLTGALPEELGLLSNLAFIRLAGNSFTGCVPHTLRDVADSDLGSVGIPYCPAPVCIRPFPNPIVINPTANVTITTPTLQLQREPFTYAMQSWDSRCRSSHAPAYNAQFYTFVNHNAEKVGDEVVIHTMRVNIKMTTRHDDASLLLLGATLLDGLEPDAPIVATAEPVKAEAGALRTLEIEKVVPYGSYSIEVRARNPDDATFDLTAAHVYDPPEFAQDSYTFSVAEDAERFTTVGTVVAVDEGGRAVTYRITSGAAGKFSITHNRGMIVVNGGLDYETTPTYTLTVEARNPDGRTSTATVTINVTDVAGK